MCIALQLSGQQCKIDIRYAKFGVESMNRMYPTQIPLKYLLAYRFQLKILQVLESFCQL